MHNSKKSSNFAPQNLTNMSRQTIFILTLCALLFIPANAAKRRVHTIGDSTMSEYKPAATPKRGWGMYLQAFFNTDSVEVNNRGKSGASTRTFYESGALWPSVKKQMSAGDYLIIQFAHNDEKCKGEDVYVYNSNLRAQGAKDTITDMRGTEPNTTYKAYLYKFIHEAREMGVTPILMSPICRAYFRDGKINNEGRHLLDAQRGKGKDKDYVRCMREVAEETGVPFLDMTAASQELFEQAGQEYCMTHYFNCGDKTHTGADGGMAVASLAYNLISQAPELAEMHPWLVFPDQEQFAAYAQNVEEAGKQAALKASGISFNKTLKPITLKNIQMHHFGYVPSSGHWPAGEIDEVANRYIEYAISADKKKGMVIESIIVPVFVKGGNGMNIHINYGFGSQFAGVTTIYENTALQRNKAMLIRLDQPILVPAGQTLFLRILPWYDSNGKPQHHKFLQLGDITIAGKRLQ